jgi:hypothetical protein
MFDAVVGLGSVSQREIWPSEGHEFEGISE